MVILWFIPALTAWSCVLYTPGRYQEIKISIKGLNCTLYWDRGGDNLYNLMMQHTTQSYHHVKVYVFSQHFYFIPSCRSRMEIIYLLFGRLFRLLYFWKNKNQRFSKSLMKNSCFIFFLFKMSSLLFYLIIRKKIFYLKASEKQRRKAYSADCMIFCQNREKIFYFYCYFFQIVSCSSLSLEMISDWPGRWGQL